MFNKIKIEKIFLKKSSIIIITGFIILISIKAVFGETALFSYETSTPSFILVEPDPESQKIQFLTTIQDLSQVGFSKVEEVKPESSRFKIPVQYFRVGEHLDPQEAQLDCVDCSNLVAVYITPQIVTSSPLWVVNNNPTIDTIGGRARIKLFVASRIIFIISSQEEYARKLAERLRERVILNNTLLNKEKTNNTVNN